MARFLRCLIPAILVVASAPALADEQGDDLGGGPTDTQVTRKRVKDEQVREIVKGFYAKTNIGASVYVGKFRSPYTKPGTSLALAIGQDFVDTQKMSLGWELSVFQGIHNGMHFEEQKGDPNAPYIEGDFRTYLLGGTLEWSTYLTRRFGVGLRGGGGVLYSPLLMPQEYYESTVLGPWNISADPGYHGQPHPVLMGGPTIEYYTKMSHFSVGADVDVQYGIGFDVAISATGALKYTF
jgi:hypothetical protein